MDTFTKNLNELRSASRLLEDSKIEYDNVISQLREKLMVLKNVPMKQATGQTRETCEGIESHIHLVNSLYESYSDILPTLEKSLADVKVEHEFDFDSETMIKIYQETNPDKLMGGSLECSPYTGPDKSLTISTPKKEQQEKKGFTWDILRKLTNGLSDSKPSNQTVELEANSLDKRKSGGSLPELDTSSGSAKQEKEWDSEVFKVMQSGVPAKKLEDRITHLITSGNPVPIKKRGILWRDLIGNRGRINKRLFRLLLGLLEKASPQVKEVIIKDMDRTYSDYKISPTYCHVKSESVKILQLFDIHRPDIGFIQGMSYIAVVLRLNMSTYHAFKCFCNLVYQSDILFANYCFDTRRINNFYIIFNHLVMRKFPEKFEIMKYYDIHPSMFMVEWFYTLFARQFSFDSLFKLWDFFFLKGEVVLFRVVLMAFAETDFKNKQPSDIMSTMKKLDKLLGPGFYKQLDGGGLSENDYMLLVHEFDSELDK